MLLLESITLAEQVYSPLSAVSTLGMLKLGLVLFITLFTLSCLPPGVVQLDVTVIEVSTKTGCIRQEKATEKPDTSVEVESVRDTSTVGLGTEGERTYLAMEISKTVVPHFVL